MNVRTRHVCVCIASAFFRASPVLDSFFKTARKGKRGAMGAMVESRPTQNTTTVEFEQQVLPSEVGRQPSLTERRRSIHRLYLRPCVRPARARDWIKEGIMSVIYMKVGGVVVSASNCETRLTGTVKQLPSCRSHRDNNFHM